MIDQCTLKGAGNKEQGHIALEKILVSACLLGARVRYHGGHAVCDDPVLQEWLNEGRVVAACPEQDGGLPTPRPPAEIVGAGTGRAVIARMAVVRTAAGADVTAPFREGADRALDLVKQHNIRIAILKDGSPSCGSSHVYDGSFSATQIAGAGVTAALLAAHGVRVFSERDLQRARECLQELSSLKSQVSTLNTGSHPET
jgi:uncharacterized protein YbbK (DUF523 family)